MNGPGCDDFDTTLNYFTGMIDCTHTILRSDLPDKLLAIQLLYNEIDLGAANAPVLSDDMVTQLFHVAIKHRVERQLDVLINEYIIPRGPIHLFNLLPRVPNLWDRIWLRVLAERCANAGPKRRRALMFLLNGMPLKYMAEFYSRLVEFDVQIDDNSEYQLRNIRRGALIAPI